MPSKHITRAPSHSISHRNGWRLILTAQALLVVNIGKPGANAWFDHQPRPEYDRVFTTY